jgi:hypothetical protein
VVTDYLRCRYGVIKLLTFIEVKFSSQNDHSDEKVGPFWAYDNFCPVVPFPQNIFVL